MKIIYLHQYFNTPQMTGSTRSYEMARRLAAKGHEVNIITSERSTSGKKLKGWRTTEESGIHVHWLHVPYSNQMSYLRRIVAFLCFAVGAAIKAVSLKVDIIFATSTPLTIAFPAVFSSKIRRTPMVFEVRDLWPAVPIAVGALKGNVQIAAAKWLERFAYRNAERIIALSPGMKRGITQTGFPAEFVHVIPNSSDFDLFDINDSLGGSFRKAHAWLENKPLVVYTGTIGYVNGIDYMVSLAHEVYKIDPDVRFLVVGRGKQEEKVRELATELGILNKSFFMIDSVPKSEIPAILSAADLATSFFIDNPALWDNSANKFFDALASGTPIAINYQGWQADLINEHKAGIVLDVNNVPDAAQKVVQLIRDPAWLEKTGSAAKTLAKDQFSRDDLAQRFEAVLLEVYKKV